MSSSFDDTQVKGSAKTKCSKCGKMVRRCRYTDSGIYYCSHCNVVFTTADTNSRPGWFQALARLFTKHRRGA